MFNVWDIYLYEHIYLCRITYYMFVDPNFHPTTKATGGCEGSGAGSGEGLDTRKPKIKTQQYI